MPIDILMEIVQDLRDNHPFGDQVEVSDGDAGPTKMDSIRVTKRRVLWQQWTTTVTASWSESSIGERSIKYPASTRGPLEKP